ncbi:MAG: hypothetical protein PHF89_08380 [Eubacteriales bacterium]|nr:hypothetical protein [Eubacteriales bacterium]
MVDSFEKANKYYEYKMSGGGNSSGGGGGCLGCATLAFFALAFAAIAAWAAFYLT